MMKTIIIGALVTFLANSPAIAQALSNDMTCDEAKKYYAEHKRIEVRDGDQVLPIYGGVAGDDPIKLECDSGDEPGPLSVPTKDEAQCQVGYRCQG